MISARSGDVGAPPPSGQGSPAETLDLDAMLEELCRRAESWESVLLPTSPDTLDQGIRTCSKVRRRFGRDEAQLAWLLVREVLLPRSEQFHGGDSPDGYAMDAILNDLHIRAGSFRAAWKLSVRTLDEVIRAHPPGPGGPDIGGGQVASREGAGHPDAVGGGSPRRVVVTSRGRDTKVAGMATSSDELFPSIHFLTELGALLGRHGYTPVGVPVAHAVGQAIPELVAFLSAYMEALPARASQSYQ